MSNDLLVGSIKRGDHVIAETATHEWVALRATSGVQDGLDFQVVWVCDDSDWERALVGKEPRAIPWPAESVKLAAEADLDEGSPRIATSAGEEVSNDEPRRPTPSR